MNAASQNAHATLSPSPVPTSAPATIQRWLNARAKATRQAERPLPIGHRRWCIESATERKTYVIVGLDEHGLRYAHVYDPTADDGHCEGFDRHGICWHLAKIADLPEEVERRAHYRAGIRVIHASQHPAFDVDAEQARLAALNARVDSLFS